MNANAKMWREFLRFGHPVENKRLRDDDERWAVATLRMPRIDEGENLDGLAEAHVIRQTGSEMEVVHGEQPAEALSLVGAERGAEG